MVHQLVLQAEDAHASTLAHVTELMNKAKREQSANTQSKAQVLCFFILEAQSPLNLPTSSSLIQRPFQTFTEPLPRMSTQSLPSRSCSANSIPKRYPFFQFLFGSLAVFFDVTQFALPPGLRPNCQGRPRAHAKGARRLASGQNGAGTHARPAGAAERHVRESSGRRAPGHAHQPVQGKPQSVSAFKRIKTYQSTSVPRAPFLRCLSFRVFHHCIILSHLVSLRSPKRRASP